MSQARIRCPLPLAFIVVLAAASTTRADPIPSAAPASAAGPATSLDETLQSEAALRAVDDHWGRAEQDGDVAYLTRLLAPEYRSIGARGEATARATLLERAGRRAGSEEARAEAHRTADAYRQAHPTEVTVVLHGTLGIVSFFNPRRGLDHSVRGADVFVYEDHRWHAIFSMHNVAE